MMSQCPYILMFQNNETAAMLVFQSSPLRVDFFSYVNASFCIDAGHVSENALQGYIHS